MKFPILAAHLAWLMACSSRAADLSPATSLDNPAVRYVVPERPYLVLRRAGIEAVIVDNRAADDSVLPGHAAGYHGVGALRHPDQPRSLFVPSYSGLNFEHIHDGTTQPREVLFEPRHAPMELRRIDDWTAELYQPPTPHWGLESCARYRLLEDGILELTFECIPRRATWKNEHLGLFWASYIHAPESLDIHFLAASAEAAPTWVRGITPEHGVRATHRAQNDDRQFPHDADFPLSLVFNFSDHRYAEPWFYGTCRGMAFAQIFRPADQMRLTQSPSGGGTGNPAWDFQWFIPKPQVGKRYQLVVKALYASYPNSANARARLTQKVGEIRKSDPAFSNAAIREEP